MQEIICKKGICKDANSIHTKLEEVYTDNLSDKIQNDLMKDLIE